ncbi:MAG TPA: glucosaminidase domain-containing protein [Phnomibacter sp.]|nr:glucosaminidase domain-containing protein [Phnomibacter sp.]
MKIVSIILAFLLPAFVQAQTQDSAYRAYIETYSLLAMAEQQRSGVPASIKLAQGLLESGAGTGELCMRSNNHFGIKCKNTWTGDKVYHDDDANGECFRAYTSADESYRDHSDFLRNNPRYAALFQLEITDYKAWAEGLKKAGYATNPRYVALLIKVVEENDLNSYTTLALQGPVALPNNDVAKGPTEPIAEKPVVAAVSKTPVATPVVQEQPILTESYPEGYFYINSTKAMFAKAGSSLLAIANENNILLSEILAFNDMSRTDILEKNQLVFVERKKKRGEIQVYEATAKESLWNISQKNGVRLNQIAFWNNLPMQAEVQKGTKIYLQDPPSGKAASTRK